MLRNVLLLALLALPLAAWPQSREKLVDNYGDLAGSKENSRSLVDGLRDGKEVTLKSADGTKTTTFTPPTGRMGNGNIRIALSLAEADLKKQGISKPTNEQLKAELTKILQERADHKGWGVIAQERGFKVGDLVRSEKATEKGERTARADRPERPEKPERPERPDRSGRGPR